MTHQTFPKPVHMPKKPNRTTAKARAKRRRASEAVKRDVYALVDARDRYVCRATGTYVGDGHGQRHHIVRRSQGGKHTTANIVTLKDLIHHRIHAGHLVITGNADDTLTFRDTVSGLEWESKPPCP